MPKSKPSLFIVFIAVFLTLPSWGEKIAFPEKPLTVSDLVKAIPVEELGKPSNNSKDWEPIDDAPYYKPVVSKPVWFEPKRFLPKDVPLLQANNNLAIEYFDGRLFIGWRNAEFHFPSKTAKMVLMSSADWGETWELEKVIALGADMREPFFYHAGGKFFFRYFGGGKSNLEFKPQDVWQLERKGKGDWTQPETVGQKHEVPWDYKAYGDRVFHSTYMGAHYDFVPTQTKNATTDQVHVFFKHSTDGEKWRYLLPAGSDEDPTKPYAIRSGGVCEASIEILPPAAGKFDASLALAGYEPYGHLISVNRNEDGEAVRQGDVKRIGSYFATAQVFKRDDDLYVQRYEETYTPYMYDSPRTLTHGTDVYLLARKVVRKFAGTEDFVPIPSEWDLRTFVGQWLAGRTPPLLVSKWGSAMRFSLYELDRDSRQVVDVHTFPSAGDTAFSSAIRIGKHSYLVANYTSPIEEGENWSWFHGQRNPTSIYFTILHFEADEEPEMRFKVKLRRFTKLLDDACDGKSEQIGKAVEVIFTRIYDDPQLLEDDKLRKKIDRLEKALRLCPGATEHFNRLQSYFVEAAGQRLSAPAEKWMLGGE